MNLYNLTAHELLDLIKAGKASAEDIASAFRKRIADVDGKTKALVRVSSGAISADQKSKSFPVPIAIKDNMCIRETETTCCSKILKGFRPPYNATVIEKLNETGAVLLAQANMDEFAFGSSCETSCYGPTFNPWDLKRVPGGSSGGSAAAVAADEVAWALGSDTGGSIRQPAAFCGIVGLKPTYGRVSRYGLVAFASSLDQIGPLTKDVRDCALLMNIISGHDPKDSTSVNVPVPDYTQSLVKDVKGLRIGIPKECFIEGLNPEVEKSVRAAIDVLKQQGASVVEISLPHMKYSVATYYILATAEASSNLARFDGVRHGLRAQPATQRKAPIVDMFEETRSQGFGAEAKRRIMLGTYSLSSGYYDAYYLKGQKARTLIKNDFDKAFEDVDIILTPTAPTTAFKVGEKVSDPLSMYLSDIYTIPANLVGIPAMSIPCGFDNEGLPIGLQLMAKPFAEEIMFRTAYTFEQSTEWHKKKPNLT